MTLRATLALVVLSACGGGQTSTTPTGVPSPTSTTRELPGSTLQTEPAPAAPDTATITTYTARPAGVTEGGGELGQGVASVTHRSGVEIRIDPGEGTRGSQLGPFGGALSPALTSIRECYARVVAARPTIEGNARIAIAVPRGRGRVRVERAAATAPEIADSELEGCVLQAIGAADYSTVDQPSNVFVALTFANTAAAGVAATQARRAAEASDAVTVDDQGRLRYQGATGGGELRYVLRAGEGVERDALVEVGGSVRAAVPSLLDCRRRAGRRGRSPAGEFHVNLRAGAPEVASSTVAAPGAGACVAAALLTATLPTGSTSAVQAEIVFGP